MPSEDWFPLSDDVKAGYDDFLGMGAVRPEIEEEVRRLLDGEGGLDAATTAALRGYGQDILEVLAAIHRDEAAASEVFAMFAEGVWRGLPKFRWGSTLRTWLYAVAQRSSLRYRRDASRRARRESPFPEDSKASMLVADLRSRTATFMRTERKQKIAALRESLPIEDQTLLMLRVDRGLSWAELVTVMGEEDELDEESAKREAARLRKRFQLIKERLHALAKKAGVEA